MVTAATTKREKGSRLRTALPRERRTASGEGLIESYSPATGEFLGSVRVTPYAEALTAVRRAREAAKTWAETSFDERGRHLRRANDYLYRHFDALAELISKENGKPRIEAEITDLTPVIYHNAYFARHARQWLAERPVAMPLWSLAGKASYLRYVPWGVVGVIAPWNYPFGIPMTQIAMALMAGNTVVFKPSSSTPLVGQTIAAVWEAAGLPPNVVTVVQGPGKLGEAFIDEPVDRLVFTGSVPIGRHLAKLAADKLIPITLELGGKDPAIVLADADLDAATSGVLWGAMANAGQTCAGIERAYVERSIFKPFVAQIAEKAKRLRVGADRDFDVDMGAITSRGQLATIVRQVEQAVAQGAKIEAGGFIIEDCCGDFYAPTILTGVSHTMAIIREENFGPVLPIMPFDSIDEAIRLANDTRFALSASVWTRDRRKARAIASQLVAGTITVNDSLYSYALAETPWGGYKDSGIGKTHGEEGLKEMTRQVHVSFDRFGRMKKPWWYPYDARLRETFAGVVRLLGGEDRGRALLRAVRNLPLRGKL
jgi:succinate-semialdehyde dehydrogenase/glutarate-semialdehyde dehydrogenase